MHPRMVRELHGWNSMVRVLCHPFKTLYPKCNFSVLHPIQAHSSSRFFKLLLNFSNYVTLKATSTVICQNDWELVSMFGFAKRRVGNFFFFIYSVTQQLNVKLMNMYLEAVIMLEIQERTQRSCPFHSGMYW